MAAFSNLSFLCHPFILAHGVVPAAINLCIKLLMPLNIVFRVPSMARDSSPCVSNRCGPAGTISPHDASIPVGICMRGSGHCHRLVTITEDGNGRGHANTGNKEAAARK